MATIIAVLNMKGGSGKTTIATNLARGLQQTGHGGGSAVLLDLDPQGTALRWYAAQEEGADLPFVTAVSPPLEKHISRLTSGYDYAVIDGPAKSRDRIRAAVIASDVVLIPVRPSAADLWSSEDVVELVSARQEVTRSESAPQGSPRAAFVVSQQIVGTNLAGEIGDVLASYELPVLDGRTAQRVAYAEALSLGTTVLDMEPGGKAAAEIRQITDETLALAHGKERTPAERTEG